MTSTTKQADRLEGWISFGAAIVLPPLFYLSQRHKLELDIWVAGLIAVTLLYYAAFCFAKGWLRTVLVAFGVLAAVAFAAVVTFVRLAAAAGVGPGFGPSAL